MKKYILWFADVDKDDIPLVGGKGANLGEMTKAGFPVPNGFIVTSDAYKTILSENHLKEKIKDILDRLDVNNSKELETASQKIQRLITRARIAAEISQAIISAYFKLDGRLLKHPYVAVRSSATAEDLPQASFAGQQSSYLNVHGEANVVEKVREAWASLFTSRAIFYRSAHHFDHFKVYIAVIVQKMINSDLSGIMFTVDPVTNEKSKLVIDAIYGLGEMIVQGAVTPDHYEVDKKSETIISKEVNTQEKIMVRRDGTSKIEHLAKQIGSRQKLSDAQTLGLTKLGKQLEKHYYFPQDAEWAIADQKIYLVQTRPITTLGENKTLDQVSILKKEIILRGDGASPGMASGPVRILNSPKEIHRLNKGDILVAEQTNPDYVPAMRKACAIITERGGRTSHAAIVSRELGIPAVVGAPNAKKVLVNNLVVTVNGSTGEIYKGAVNRELRTKNLELKKSEFHKTATKVYVNLAEPSRAREISRLPVDGVGLLRAEFMIAGIGVHPKKLIKDRKQKVFVDTLSEQLEIFCSSFSPRPVIYRTTDFKTNEYRNLSGGKAYEPEESNPMLGFRGAARYIADSKVFNLEIEALKTVRNKMGYKNLWAMLPFVRMPKELLEVKKLLAAHGLVRSPTFKLWLMVEIPSNVIRINDFIDVGIDGVSIGSNDLTMLMLGTDRDNSDVAHLFSEQDPTLLWAFEHVIKTAIKRNIAVSMCGQAPSDYPELVEKLVEWGITSVSVNPDAVANVRETIYQAEQKLVHKVSS